MSKKETKSVAAALAKSFDRFQRVLDRIVVPDAQDVYMATYKCLIKDIRKNGVGSTIVGWRGKLKFSIYERLDCEELDCFGLEEFMGSVFEEMACPETRRIAKLAVKEFTAMCEKLKSEIGKHE